MVPIIISAGVSRAMDGAPVTLSDGSQLWMQNVGVIWVPLIVIVTAAAWLGINDMAEALMM